LLSEVFYWLLNMSVSASIAGICLILLRRIRKIPRRILYLLWVLPLFRMWIPIGMNSPYSLLSLISKITTKAVPIYQGSVAFSMTNYVMAANTYFPIAYKSSCLETAFQIASAVWVVVATALLLAMLLLYIATKSELKDARHLRDNLYVSDRVTATAVYGIFGAKIILSQADEEADLRFILLHENIHIKRRDNLWRMVGIITACLHWFNPLSWLFLKLFFTDLELACDEAVLAQCGEAEKKNYANALLNGIERKSLYVSAFGGAKVRVRIDRILSYQRLSIVAAIFLATLSVVIGYILLTNAI